MIHKILAVFGTRPEAIKMCPLVIRLKKDKALECIVCLTGQHKEMLNQVIDVFDIKADYDLAIMKENQSLESITMSIVNGISEIIGKEKPDLVLVHGDTTTAFAAGLASFYRNVKVGHVEAGLRTHDLSAPFPEEFNRQAVDLIASIYFAPTESAKLNLLNEGKDIEKIFVTGNTVIDAMKSTIRDDYKDENLQWAKDSRMILVTAHRRENIGPAMENIFHAIKKVAEDFSDVKIIFPVHKNPKVRQIANHILGDIANIRLIEPLDVIQFHNYMRRSFLIMTDSGGVQEEAPALGVPVLVLRETTERPEGVDAGVLRVVGTSTDAIYDSAKELLTCSDIYEEMHKAKNPYGDGFASERIYKAIIKLLGGEHA